MSVSLVKQGPVSLVKRYRRGPGVSLAKTNPVVRVARVHLKSAVLRCVDVVERADGSVWYAARRRGDAPFLDGAPVKYTRVCRSWLTALDDRWMFERGAGCAVSVSLPVGGWWDLRFGR